MYQQANILTIQKKEINLPGRAFSSKLSSFLSIHPAIWVIFCLAVARRRRKEGRPRRQRTTFSAHQTLRLELEYARGEYVARARRYTNTSNFVDFL